MKNIYLFCSKPWVYLTEIPVIILFWIAFKFNDKADGVLKFYPLMAVSACAIIFIMLYFFRYISVNNDEIRCQGLFSSKDNVLIQENRNLIITIHPHSNLKLEVYADASEAPAFDWMTASDVAHRDVCIFRAKATGGKRAVSRVLDFFTLPKDEIPSAFDDGFKFENEVIKVSTKQENEVSKIKINFKTTII